jgi:lipopolysaccharide/colanic/teichoic acid biosynthesis glycosyltransferase
LERTQLVESLQLFNVIFHGISLVGNRPLPFENLQLLRKFSGWDKRFNSPAGITGITQIVGKLNQNPGERIEMEKLYSEVYQTGNILKIDFLILIYTLRLLISGKHLTISEAKDMLTQ